MSRIWVDSEETFSSMNGGQNRLGLIGSGGENLGRVTFGRDFRSHD